MTATPIASGRKVWIRASLVFAFLCRASSNEATEPVQKSMAKPNVDYGHAARLLAVRMPREHLLSTTFDDDIAAKALSLYIEKLDPSRSWFLAADIRDLKKGRAGLADSIQAGDFELGKRIHQILLERIADRIAFVSRLLSREFDMDTDEAYCHVRDDEPWPADRAAWDELWRKRIKNEYLIEVVKRAPLQQRKPDAIGRYGPTGLAEPALSSAVVVAPTTNSIEGNILERYQQLERRRREKPTDEIVAEYLDAFANAYDPHTTYLPPSRMAEFTNRDVAGIGVQLVRDGDLVKIERVIGGGAAEIDRRLRAGDAILAIAQGTNPPVSVVYCTPEEVEGTLQGQEGTDVELFVTPAWASSQAFTRRIRIRRAKPTTWTDVVHAKQRDVSVPLVGVYRLGVIVVPSFYANMSMLLKTTNTTSPEMGASVSQDIEATLKKSHEEGSAGVLLDLRGNGGGSLLEGIRTAGLFLPPGPVMQIKERNRVRPMNNFYPSVAYDGPLVILADRRSAGSAEILAAALQDYGRALVVGDSTTYGLGTIASLIDLQSNDGCGGLRVSTASFYRVDGQPFQSKGVVPDILLPSAYDPLRIGEQYLKHPLQVPSVEPIHYLPRKELKSLLPELLGRSAKRRAQDPLYQKQTENLSRLAARVASKDLPLRLRDRLTLASHERELDALILPKSDYAPDLILDEALRILADLVSLQITSTPKSTP